MKSISLFTIIILFVLQALAQESLKSVTITGSLIHPKNSEPSIMKINFLNPFVNVSSSVKLEATPFMTKGDMLFTQNITIQYNRTFINLYVAPGDSVNLLVDGALLDEPDFKWLTISGDHALISTQLNKCHFFISNLPYKKYDYTISVPNMLTAVKTDYERQLAALDNYAKTYPIDPIVLAFEKRDIIYGISNWIGDYVHLGSEETSTKADRNKLFSDSLFDIYNDLNFETMMFPYHLSAYALWLTNEDIEFKKATEAKDVKKIIIAGATRLLQEPATLSRDYMMFTFLTRCIKNMPGVVDQLPQISTYFSKHVYYNLFKNYVTLANTVGFPITPIAGVKYLTSNTNQVSLATTDIFQYFAKKYSGKVLYLDVYATWCGPCLEEMKLAPTLHNQFKGKDIVFINLCLSSETVDWLKLVERSKLTGENYFLNEDATKIFMTAYNLKGYPSYLLVNKSGKLVSNSAPRISESSTLNNILAKLADTK